MDGLRDHINKLREDFSRGVLTEEGIDKDPSLQFNTWLNQAVEAKVPEFQAMNLATASPTGKPSSRIVYLREFGDNRFWFYTNYESRKAKELAGSPYACLTFFWPELERQVRIEGTVEKATEAQSDAYYNARPYDSKIGAWASAQSEALSSRQQLEDKVAELKKRFTPETIIRPKHWGGFVLQANYYEFWQGRKSRLHDRIAFTFLQNAWTVSRLAP